jgi:hypothetical protein
MNKYRFDGDICYIEINSLKYGKFEAIIDSEDYNRVRMFNWNLNFHGSDGRIYAVSSIRCFNKYQQIKLHRLVTSFEFAMVDHINRDPLDNRKSNLRDSTSSLNNFNSLYKGRSRKLPRCIYKNKSKYRVAFQKDGETYYKGKFESISDAVCFRDSEFTRLWGFVP